MKPLLLIGLAVLVLGIASLMIPIPHNEREGVNLGGVSLGVETHDSEKTPPILSAVIILAGTSLMIAAKVKS
jgi:hypothetical protein